MYYVEGLLFSVSLGSEWDKLYFVPFSFFLALTRSNLISHSSDETEFIAAFRCEVTNIFSRESLGKWLTQRCLSIHLATVFNLPVHEIVSCFDDNWELEVVLHLQTALAYLDFLGKLNQSSCSVLFMSPQEKRKGCVCRRGLLNSCFCSLWSRCCCCWCIQWLNAWPRCFFYWLVSI